MPIVFAVTRSIELHAALGHGTVRASARDGLGLGGAFPAWLVDRPSSYRCFNEGLLSVLKAALISLVFFSAFARRTGLW